jgi:hypothetical protein
MFSEFLPSKLLLLCKASGQQQSMPIKLIHYGTLSSQCLPAGVAPAKNDVLTAKIQEFYVTNVVTDGSSSAA